MLGGVGFAFCAFTGTKNFRILISVAKIWKFSAGGFTARRIQASTQNCRDSGWLIVGLAACMVPAACPTNLLNWAEQHREHGAFVDERALKFAASPETVE